MSKVAEVLSRLAEAERRYAEELRELAGSIRYAQTLSAIFAALASDSEKHGELYEALARIAVGEESRRELFREDLELISRTIERHIEVERKMVEESRKLLDEMDDPRVILLLSAIYEDEIMHHRLLLDIRDKVAKLRGVNEEEFWDAVWKDSPWHGTPGG